MIHISFHNFQKKICSFIYEQNNNKKKLGKMNIYCALYSSPWIHGQYSEIPFKFISYMSRFEYHYIYSFFNSSNNNNNKNIQTNRECCKEKWPWIPEIYIIFSFFFHRHLYSGNNNDKKRNINCIDIDRFWILSIEATANE